MSSKIFPTNFILKKFFNFVKKKFMLEFKIQVYIDTDPKSTVSFEDKRSFGLMEEKDVAYYINPGKKSDLMELRESYVMEDGLLVKCTICSFKNFETYPILENIKTVKEKLNNYYEQNSKDSKII